MCSASSHDLTARSRIRDAAIACFAQQGFGASVRTIAARAGVSPGLVVHHFGSKARLREVCDEYVRKVIADVKTESAGSVDPASFLHQLATLDEYALILGYLVRSLREGGPLASALYEQLTEDSKRYLALGVEAGTISPSRDPDARARYLVSVSLGSLLLHVTLHHGGPESDYGQVLHEWTAEYMLPALELFTEPILPDSGLLDTYLQHREDTSSENGTA